MDDEKYMTTELPEWLLIELKVLAARRKTTVRTLVTAGMTTWLIEQGVALPAATTTEVKS